MSDAESTRSVIAFMRALENANFRNSEVVLHASDWMELRDAIFGDSSENERLREALGVLCFADMGKDEGRALSTQEVWEIIYNDRVQDWFSYDEIEEARNTLASKDRP